MKNILKRSAYQQFPDFDLRVAPHKSYIYIQSKDAPSDTIIFSKENYRVEERPNPDKIPQGPHFKHRRFWFWKKRDGWVWGNKLKGCVHIDKLSEDKENEVCRFSQRASLRLTTRMACYFNSEADSVVVNLDAWEAFLRRKPKPATDYTHRTGYVVYSTPEEKVNQKLEDLFL